MIGEISTTRNNHLQHFIKRWAKPIRLCILAAFLGIAMSGCTPLGTVKPDCSKRATDVQVSANCRFHEGDYTGALEDYRKAAQADARKALVARQLLDASQVLAAQWKLLLTSDYLDSSLALSRQLGDKALIGQALLYQGETAYRLGDYTKSRQHIDQAQAYLQQSGQHVLAIRNRNNLGNTLSNLGQYQQAEAALNQALSEARKQGNKAYIAQSYSNIGGLRFNLRRFASAIEAIDQSEAFAKAANNARLIAHAATLKGAVYRQQSDFDAALREYKRALAIASRFPKQLKHQTGTIKRVIAELLIYYPDAKQKDNLAQAEKYLQDVLARHKDNPVELGLALNHLGEIALKRGDQAQAIQYFEQGLQNYLSLEYPDGVGRSHINLGRAYNDRRDYQQAIQSLDKAHSIYASLDDREWLRVGLYERGLAYERLGNIAQAEKNYRQSVDQLESIRGDVYGDQAAQELFTEVNAEVYERLISLLMEKGDIEGALEYIERSRLKALDEYLMQSRGDSDTDTPLGADRDKVAKAHLDISKDQQLRKDAAQSLLSGGVKVRQLINSAAKDFQGRQKKTARLSLNLGLQSIDLGELNKITPDTAVITYFPTPKATYIIVSRGGKKPVGYTLKTLDKNALREQLFKALDYLDSGKSLLSRENLEAGVTDTEGREILATLYQVFISPISDAIKDAKTLVIYPHDFLVYLPFETLLSPDDQFLVQEKRIVYLHSIDGDSSLPEIGKPNANFNAASAVVFANPLPLPEGMASLEFAADEANKIKQSFPNSLILDGRKATKQAFLEQWGKHDIVHVAAHGRASDEETALFLGGNEDNGKLTEDDISDLDNSSRKTRLVVLSACETAVDAGLAFVDPNDPVASLGLAGMVHLFSYYHRIPSRIGSLWKVNDQQTARLMGDMYQSMADKRQASYGAFRSAQLAMIARGGRFKHPYFWAGFVYFGDPD